MKNIRRTPVTKEIWKKCSVIMKNKLINFPDYEVSNLGRVRVVTENNCPTSHVGKIIKHVIIKGYHIVCAYSRTGRRYSVRVHRLVAHAFLGPCPKGKQVNHKDGIKSHNSVDNLEYVSSKENIRHAWKLGLANYSGVNNMNSSLTEEDVILIKKLLNRKIPPSYKSIANQFGITEYVVKGIKFNRTYKNIGGKVKERDFLKFRHKNYPESFGKLSVNDVKEIKKLFKKDNDFKVTDIAKRFNVGRLAISRIINNRTWKDVTV